MDAKADDGRGVLEERADDLHRTADSMAQLTRETLHGDTRVGLGLLVDVAVRTVPSADWVSVTTLDHGIFRTVASNAPRAVELDRLQYELGTGPCVDAVLHDGSFCTGDVAHEPRWQPLGQRAHECLGVNSMLALRLYLLDESGTLAGLNLSSTRVDAFTDADVDRARVLATHCALLVTAVQERQRAAQLMAALRSNREIAMAVGVLMGRYLLTRDQAFDVLRHASQNSNTKLRDVAAQVVQTGEYPRWGWAGDRRGDPRA